MGFSPQKCFITDINTSQHPKEADKDLGKNVQLESKTKVKNEENNSFGPTDIDYHMNYVDSVKDWLMERGDVLIELNQVNLFM